jgi:hypothetical protein
MLPLLSVISDPQLRSELRNVAFSAQASLVAERGLLMETQVLEILAELMSTSQNQQQAKDPGQSDFTHLRLLPPSVVSRRALAGWSAIRTAASHDRLRLYRDNHCGPGGHRKRHQCKDKGGDFHVVLPPKAETENDFIPTFSGPSPKRNHHNAAGLAGGGHLRTSIDMQPSSRLLRSENGLRDHPVDALGAVDHLGDMIIDRDARDHVGLLTRKLGEALGDEKDGLAHRHLHRLL